MKHAERRQFETEFAWAAGFREFSSALGRISSAASDDRRPPPIAPLSPASSEPFSVIAGHEYTFGPDSSSDAVLERLSAARLGASADPEMVLVKLPRSGDPGVFWIVDCRRGAGLWVNGLRCDLHRLDHGDLVQLGPYAWLFSAADAYFVPVGPIEGARLSITGTLGMGSTEHHLNLVIEPGEFVAIVGESGAGKSTLVRIMLGLTDERWSGNVTIDRHDAQADRD